MPVNPYAKTYGSSRRRRRLLLKIPSEDAVAEFNNALDAAATDELELSQQRGTATTTGDDSTNTVSVVFVGSSGVGVVTAFVKIRVPYLSGLRLRRSLH